MVLRNWHASFSLFSVAACNDQLAVPLSTNHRILFPCFGRQHSLPWHLHWISLDTSCARDMLDDVTWTTEHLCCLQITLSKKTTSTITTINSIGGTSNTFCNLFNSPRLCLCDWLGLEWTNNWLQLAGHRLTKPAAALSLFNPFSALFFCPPFAASHFSTHANTWAFFY